MPSENSPSPRECGTRIAERLEEAGIITERFIDVVDGEKRSIIQHSDSANHTGPEQISGNYGIYAGKGLIVIDVDDYSPAAGGESLRAVMSLPETFSIRTPHTDGRTGGHFLYKVTPGDKHESADDAIQHVTGLEGVSKRNSKLSWGEIRAHNQYVVGPGSQLNDCSKEWCDKCAEPEGGRYAISNDVPIATISADTLAEVLLADSAAREGTEVDRPISPSPPERGRNGQSGILSGKIGDRVRDAFNNSKDGNRMRQVYHGGWESAGFPDRSTAEYWLACRLDQWVGHGDRRVVARLMDRGYLPKWSQRADASYRDSVLSGVGHQDIYFNPTTGAPQSVPHDTRGEGQILPIGPSSVRALAGLGEDGDIRDLSDRQKAAHVWDLILQSDDYHVRVREDNGSIWSYDDGIWGPDGERALRHAARQALGSVNYGRNVLAELKAQARSDPSAEVAGGIFGVKPGLLAVENGLLNLETRELRPLRPDDYALARLPVTYDPEADCPRWEQFIVESVEPAMRQAIQEYSGYSLLDGEMPYHCALLAVGAGANGKSTYLNVIHALLGDENTTGYSLGDLSHNEYYVAEMYGALANIDADVTSGIGYGGQFLKLTGGDKKVTARRPYGEPFDYKPTTKLFFGANAVPETKRDDDAFFRRWLIVEFPTTFTEPDQPGPDIDPDLEDKLIDELPGILNWCLDGLDRLREQGHFTNEGTTEEKRERWLRWGDTVDRFVSACVDTDVDGRWTTKEVYARYTTWVRRELGDTPESQQTVTAALKRLDGVRYSKNLRVDGKKERGFVGFGFTTEAPEPDAEAGDEVDDLEDRGKQTVLSQHDAYTRVLHAVDSLADSDHADGASVKAVIDAVALEVGGADRARDIVATLRERGDLFEPQDGLVRRS